MTTEPHARNKQLKSPLPPPTKIITITNQKGGVGKTTTVVNCAWMAVELDPRPALVIELCPQGNASATLYGKDYEEAASLKSYQLLLTGHAEGEPLIGKDNIEIICASNELADIDRTELNAATRNFMQNVKRLAATNRWSWIFIDTPPSLGTLQWAALSVTDYVVIPVGLNSYSMQGLGKLVDTIASVEENNPTLTVLGILPNMVNASRREQMDALKAIVTEFGDAVMNPIRDRAPIADAIDRGHAVWKNIRSGNARTAAQEVRAVVIDILRRAR